jgi:hypothetical protein
MIFHKFTGDRHIADLIICNASGSSEDPSNAFPVKGV